ncbi:hypothetical protein CGK66_09115 [Vibrio parahaemolyticus]|nr:hypothetical protein CGK66_09115 [Vibrio parahaemolyticus]TNY93939.1 hypothetical protein CGK59_02630 [Vibrio parahaemolyticus]
MEHECNIPPPLDLDKLVSEGVIKKIGKSYYASSLDELPREVSFYLKQPKKGLYGIKLEFLTPPKGLLQRSR